MLLCRVVRASPKGTCGRQRNIPLLCVVTTPQAQIIEQLVAQLGGVVVGGTASSTGTSGTASSTGGCPVRIQAGPVYSDLLLSVGGTCAASG